MTSMLFLIPWVRAKTVLGVGRREGNVLILTQNCFQI